MGDSTGICKFQTVFNSPHAAKFEEFSELIRLTCGLELPQRLYWRRESVCTRQSAGFSANSVSRARTILSRTATTTNLWTSPWRRGAHIDREEFQGMLDEYYGHHGWDNEGVPSASTLQRLGVA